VIETRVQAELIQQHHTYTLPHNATMRQHDFHKEKKGFQTVPAFRALSLRADMAGLT
jgi:hypothetical protein